MLPISIYYIIASHRATLLEESIRMQKGDEENSVHMVYSHVEPIKGTLLYSKRAFNLSLFSVSPYIFFHSFHRLRRHRSHLLLFMMIRKF